MGQRAFACSVSEEQSRRRADNTGVFAGCCRQATPVPPTHRVTLMGTYNAAELIHAAAVEPSPNSRQGGLPAFPVDVLPPLWRDWCQAAAREAGTPIDYVATTLLTTAASLIGGVRRISPMSAWREPCVLWSALVGGPASGKTRGMQCGLSLMQELQQRLGTTGESAWRRHAAAREAARVGTSLWRRDLRNMVIAGAEPDPLPDAAIEPPPPCRLVVDDARVRAVADALHGSPRGVLLAPGALDGWLARIARQPSGTDRCHWRKAWSATPWTISRRHQPIIDIPSAVSILGTLEPKALPSLCASHDDSMIGRFLFVCPSRPVLRPLSPTTGTMNAEAVDALVRLHAMAAAPRDVPVATEALDMFEAFRQDHDERIEALEGQEAAWWSEGTGVVLRLAGVLTFLDWSTRPAGTTEPAEIAASAMRTAVDLWLDYFWPHARWVLGAAADGERRRHADKVLRWIAAQGLSEVSREQIRREALSQAVDADGADAIVALLVAQGWLQPSDGTSAGRGRPRRRWQVANPALASAEDPTVRQGDDRALETEASRAFLLGSSPAISASAFDSAGTRERSEGSIEPSARADRQDVTARVDNGSRQTRGSTRPALRAERPTPGHIVRPGPIPAISATISASETSPPSAGRWNVGHCLPSEHW